MRGYYPKFNYLAPDGSHKYSFDHLYYTAIYSLKEYTGDQWDEDSPNVTISLKGHETGATNEYVFDDFEEAGDYVNHPSTVLPRGFLFH